ncbi:hypothetical protein B9Q13_00155 [Candidatus Marsarchaeota G2 archaeon ECH_B_SAG-G16]|uniref:OsmC family peroxiredoxin n=1 Tax=Candidatus Marsarchaeota G2 archaeon ECH_B_SAG-G16 TaxID=1978167 RepID=A0A2R6C5D5_9ARCH|nr:MAG: hypothetical protein B9Q13_00155 [Candidatus Marsarchaeota G2 archaeon ECH_B_SAG-G16]
MERIKHQTQWSTSCLRKLVASLSCSKRLPKRKKIQLKNIKIEALSSFALSEFLSGKSTRLEEIKLLVELESDAKLEELKKLLKEAEKICPVKNTLSAKVSVELKEANFKIKD